MLPSFPLALTPPKLKVRNSKRPQHFLWVKPPDRPHSRNDGRKRVERSLHNHYKTWRKAARLSCFFYLIFTELRFPKWHPLWPTWSRPFPPRMDGARLPSQRRLWTVFPTLPSPRATSWVAWPIGQPTARASVADDSSITGITEVCLNPLISYQDAHRQKLPSCWQFTHHWHTLRIRPTDLRCWNRCYLHCSGYRSRRGILLRRQQRADQDPIWPWRHLHSRWPWRAWRSAGCQGRPWWSHGTRWPWWPRRLR